MRQNGLTDRTIDRPRERMKKKKMLNSLKPEKILKEKLITTQEAMWLSLS